MNQNQSKNQFHPDVSESTNLKWNDGESTQESQELGELELNESSRQDDQTTQQSSDSPTSSELRAMHSSSYFFRGVSSPPLSGPRLRLDTEETAVIRNGRQLSYNDTQYYNTNCDDDYDDEYEDYNNEDDFSAVSGLSNDENSLLMARRNMFQIDPKMKGALPPSEVVVTMPSDSSDDGDIHTDMDDTGSQIPFRQLPLALTTNGMSPVVTRPTMNRHHSCPNKSAASFSSFPAVDGTTCHAYYHDDDHSVAQRSQHSDLLGYRKRHMRSPSCGASIISVGTFVGQSSLKTAPTISSELSFDASIIKRNFQSAHHAEKLMLQLAGLDPLIRKRNVVKEEIKYFFGVVASPIRKIPFLKPKPVKLQRSNGTLT
jgi:hypothetical protein